MGPALLSSHTTGLRRGNLQPAHSRRVYILQTLSEAGRATHHLGTSCAHPGKSVLSTSRPWVYTSNLTLRGQHPVPGEVY